MITMNVLFRSDFKVLSYLFCFTKILKFSVYNSQMLVAYLTVFYIGKSLSVLQKACIMIVACAIYLYTLNTYFFSHKCTLLFCWKIKSSCDPWCFPQQIRPQTTVQWYILWEHSNVRIDFSMINKGHTLPYSIHHVS